MSKTRQKQMKTKSSRELYCHSTLKMIKHSLPNYALGRFSCLWLGCILVSRVRGEEKKLIQSEAADWTLQHRVYHSDDVFSVTSA